MPEGADVTAADGVELAQALLEREVTVLERLEDLP